MKEKFKTLTVHDARIAFTLKICKNLNGKVLRKRLFKIAFSHLFDRYYLTYGLVRTHRYLYQHYKIIYNGVYYGITDKDKLIVFAILSMWCQMSFCCKVFFFILTMTRVSLPAAPCRHVDLLMDMLDH